MRCLKIQEQLSIYDYGGLTWWRRWPMGRHLARCPDCARELAVLQRTAEVIPTVPQRAAPEGLWERVWEGIETDKARLRLAGKAKPRLRGWRWAPAGAAAAAISLVALGLFWTRAPSAPGPDAFDNPRPYVHYHHLLAHQEAMADSAGLDVLAMAGRQREGDWKPEG